MNAISHTISQVQWRKFEWSNRVSRDVCTIYNGLGPWFDDSAMHKATVDPTPAAEDLVARSA